MDSTANARGDALILVAAVIWGIAFYFQKTAMEDIGPLLFTGLRGAVAALVLLPLMLREARTSSRPGGEAVPIALVGGLLFFSAGAIQQAGLVTATVINTGLLTSLYVVVTPLMFWAIERQRPANMVWIASLVAFAGVWSLSGGHLGRLSWGDWLVVIAVLGWSAQIVVAGRAGRFGRPVTYTFTQFCVVGVLGLASAFAFEAFSLDDVVRAFDAILYVGVLSTAITFTLMAVALQRTPAPRATILLSTEVVFSSAAGYFLLGERLPLMGWMGALLIIAAVLLVRVNDASA